MSEPMTFVILALVIARVTRFIWRDDLILNTRIRVKTWLQLGHIPEDVVGTPKMEEWLNEYHTEHPRREVLRQKAFDLIDCAWCSSIWVAGFLVLFCHLISNVWFDVDITMPLPVFWWPALSMAAVIPLQWTDGQFEVTATVKTPVKTPTK